LQELLRKYPDVALAHAIKEKDYDNNTVLHDATHNPASLRLLLAALPKEMRLAAIKEKGVQGCTVLQRAASCSSESLKILLAQYPEQSRLAAIKEGMEAGVSVLDYAANNTNLLFSLLELFPEAERLGILKEYTSTGETVLDIAARNPRVPFFNCLSRLPEAERLGLINERDNNGNLTFFEQMKGRVELGLIITLLPQQSLQGLPSEIKKLPPVNKLIMRLTKENYQAALGQSEDPGSTHERDETRPKSGQNP
jgi:hypothetical protein